MSFGQSKIQRVMWEGKEKTLYPYQGQSLQVKKGEVMVTFSEQKKDVIGNSIETHKIEGGIKTRINKLYKILEHRFQSDVNIWLSHIQFLKTIKWDSSVSRIYLRLLQVHSDKPRLWVAAAKWEFEEIGNPDNGRQIMLRGLRFLPTSWVLHREYLKLELLYVEQLRKRSDVLGVEKTEEEMEDKVLDCAIVRLVAKAAVEAVSSPKFVVSLIATARLFPFATVVSKELMDILEEMFPTSPVTWDTLAREELGEEVEWRGTRVTQKTKSCLLIYNNTFIPLIYMRTTTKKNFRLIGAYLGVAQTSSKNGQNWAKIHTKWPINRYPFCIDYNFLPSAVINLVF